MKTVKTAFQSLLMCLVILFIIILTDYTMHRLFGTDHDLYSITFTMAFGCMWQWCYNEIKKFNDEEDKED